MQNEHTVKSFDDDLKRLDRMIAEMGGMAEAQLSGALDALLRRDTEAAEKVEAADRDVDAIEREIDAHAVRLLTLRQPMADDLRGIVVALKTAAIIERIGDYAKNIAKRTHALSQCPPIGTTTSIKRLADLVQGMIRDILDAYVTRDADKALDVRSRDEEVDALHTGLFREFLTYMMEDAQRIAPCTHLLFVAKNIERIGDHATNIAENVHFLVNGEMPEDARPKGDNSVYVATPDGAEG